MAQRRARKTTTPPPTVAASIPLPIPEALQELGVRQSLFLLAAIADAPSTTGFRYAKARNRLAPHWGFATQILDELAECGAITLRPPMESYRSWAPTAPSEPDWSLSTRFESIPHLQTHLTRHAQALAAVPGADEELFTLWRELVISEAAGYLGHELNDHRFDESWALSAVPALEKGLRRMSANQMFYFCWMSVRETASRYLRYPGAVHTLAEGLVAYIDQRVDRALAERWTIRDWNYSSRRVPSSVATVFAEQLTDLGAEYLGSVPSRARVDMSARPAARSRGF